MLKRHLKVHKRTFAIIVPFLSLWKTTIFTRSAIRMTWQCLAILYVTSAHDKFPIPLHWLYIYDHYQRLVWLRQTNQGHPSADTNQILCCTHSASYYSKQYEMSNGSWSVWGGSIEIRLISSTMILQYSINCTGAHINNIDVHIICIKDKVIIAE